jgi:hypothetical protein
MYYSGTLKKCVGNISSQQILDVGSEEPWSKLTENFGNFLGKTESIEFSIRLIFLELYTLALFWVSKT